MFFLASVSARLREFSPPIWTPRQFADYASSEVSDKVALIFGNERFGLPNEIVIKSNVLINIPANPDYSSLNLAQAVQLLSYECRIAASDAEFRRTEQQNPVTNDAVAQIGFQGKLAPATDVERMYTHLEQALVAIDFLDPESPKKLMPRLKRLFSRAQIEVEEVNIVRGIAKKSWISARNH